MKGIAILLTVFNRKEKTLQCLQQLYAQTIPEGYTFDVWLTDDGCTDGTPEAIKETYPKVNIIQGDGNLFWNRGMYKAWEAASNKRDYDFYLWLNDDTWVYPFMLSKLLEVSKNKDDKAIIVGATQSTDHSKPTYGGRMADGKIATTGKGAVKVHHFNGNIVLVPKSVFKRLGNLDWYFTHSKGDFDYGLRARKKGFEIWQVGEYLGECDTHPTLDKWCNPQTPFRKRWKAMWKPNGMPPHETFHLEKQHLGVLSASFHYCTIILRCCFPKLWMK